jgi:hypothetical protein
MTSREKWTGCSPRSEIVYCCQLIVAVIVIIVGLVNIILTDDDACLWSSLVSGTLGYLLPSPTLHRDEPILPDAAVELVDGLLPDEHGVSVYDETASSDRA